MTESAQPTSASETNPDGSPSGVVGDGSTGAPSGLVPVGEVEKLQEQVRRLQSERDRAVAQVTRPVLGATPAPAAGGLGGPHSEAFVIGTAVSEAVAQVFRAGEMRDTAQSLRSEFPYADPALFGADRLAHFNSPEALRLAVEDSHGRVAAILGAESQRQAEEERVRLAAQHGGAAGPATTPPPASGEALTLEQLAALPFDELDRRLKADPELAKRLGVGVTV